MQFALDSYQVSEIKWHGVCYGREICGGCLSKQDTREIEAEEQTKRLIRNEWKSLGKFRRVTHRFNTKQKCKFCVHVMQGQVIKIQVMHIPDENVYLGKCEDITYACIGTRKVWQV